MQTKFADRAEAASLLARALTARRWEGRVVVLALPCGGVSIGAEVARALGAVLDLLLVRKIGAPWQPELAVAAVVDGRPPQLVVHEELRSIAGLDRRQIERHVPEALREIERRRRIYLQGRTPADLRDAIVIVVDDGMATGTTMRAALCGLRRSGPRRIVVAVPVAPADSLATLHADADDIVCLRTPAAFLAIGHHYVDFPEVGDEEVLQALDAAAHRCAAPADAAAGRPPGTATGAGGR
jgi:putative phosphoribosyl transferase